KNRCSVGEEKLAMTVENAKTPSGGHQKSRARKKNANEENGEFAFFAMEAGGDGVDQPRSGEHTQENQERGAKREKSGDGTCGLASFFFVFAGKKIGVNRNKRGGENTFAKKILQEIGDAEGGLEDVGGIGIAEVVGENAVANEACNTGEKDSSGDKKSEASGT